LEKNILNSLSSNAAHRFIQTKKTSAVSPPEMTATYRELIVIKPKMWTQVQHWEKKTKNM